MSKFDFCRLCWGILHRKCPFCKMNITDYRKICHGQVEHNLYLRRVWCNLRDFNSLTTGLFSQDEELSQMWGHWRHLSIAESYARDVMRGKTYPKGLVGSSLGNEIDSIVHKLSEQRLKGKFDEGPSI